MAETSRAQRSTSHLWMATSRMPSQIWAYETRTFAGRPDGATGSAAAAAANWLFPAANAASAGSNERPLTPSEIISGMANIERTETMIETPSHKKS